TQLPDDVELLARHEDLVLTGAGRIHVHRREDPLVGQGPVELELHVPGALELLEDHLVGTRTGLDQSRGQDGQRTATLDVARRTEETLRRVQGRGVHTTGHDASAGRGRQVVGATQTGDGVQQDDHVHAHLHKTLGPLDGQISHDRVVLGRAVEGRMDDLALDRALHVGDLLGTLVHEDHHEVALRVVLGDGVGDRLHHHCLSRLGRGDDETTLTLADGRDQVDDACGQHVRLGLQPQALLRVERDQLGKFLALLGLVRGHTVHRVQPHQGVELLATLTLAGLTDRADDVVTLAQAVLANLSQRDVDVALAGQVTGGAHEGVVVQDVEDPGNRQKDVVLGDHRFGLLASSPAVTAVTAPSPSTAATGIVVAVTALALAAPALLLIVVLVVAATAATAAAVAVTSITLAFSPLSGAVSVPVVGGGGSVLLGGARCLRHAARGGR